MFILIEYVIGFKLQNVIISGMYRAHYIISMKLPIWKARKNFKNNMNKFKQKAAELKKLLNHCDLMLVRKQN